MMFGIVGIWASEAMHADCGGMSARDVELSPKQETRVEQQSRTLGLLHRCYYKTDACG